MTGAERFRREVTAARAGNRAGGFVGANRKSVERQLLSEEEIVARDGTERQTELTGECRSDNP